MLDTFYRTVDCGALLSPELAQETGLTQEALAGGVSVKEALGALSAFMEGSCPVAFGRGRWPCSMPMGRPWDGIVGGICGP